MGTNISDSDDKKRKMSIHFTKFKVRPCRISTCILIPFKFATHFSLCIQLRERNCSKILPIAQVGALLSWVQLFQSVIIGITQVCGFLCSLRVGMEHLYTLPVVHPKQCNELI